MSMWKQFIVKEVPQSDELTDNDHVNLKPPCWFTELQRVSAHCPAVRPTALLFRFILSALIAPRSGQQAAVFTTTKKTLHATCSAANVRQTQ